MMSWSCSFQQHWIYYKGLYRKKKKKSDNNYANHTADTAIIMTVSTFIICFGGVQSGCVKAQATYTLSSGHCVTHHNVWKEQ